MILCFAIAVVSGESFVLRASEEVKKGSALRVEDGDKPKLLILSVHKNQLRHSERSLRCEESLFLCRMRCVETEGPLTQKTDHAPAFTQENGAAEQGYQIAGTVVNAVTGAALARVKVSIADTRERMRRVETITGEGGHFEFAGLPAGKYSLQGSRSGYLMSSYQQHEQFSTAIVTGPEYATDKLVLRLMPMATIAGHVQDESGEPVRSAQVQLFMEDHSWGLNRVTGAGGATSDDRGYFDIGVLRPGTYFVSASAKPWYAVHPRASLATAVDTTPKVSPGLDVAYATTFFGGATEAENAAAITLKGGERQEVEITLTPVPGLRVLFRVPGAEQPEALVQGDTQESVERAMQSRMRTMRFPVLQKRVFDSEEFVTQGQIQPVSPGVYEITGIPPGRYEMSLRGVDPNATQQFNEIDVTHNGQDLTGTPKDTLGKLKVTVKLPEGEPLPRQYAVGLRDAQQKIVAFQQGDPKGEVNFQAVRPGKYGIVFATPGKQYAVKSTVSNAGEAVGHEVNMTAGAELEVTAELVEGVVRIEGVAEKNGKPVAGVMVALVPNDPVAHVDLFRRDQSDFDGTFTLPGVVPGTYTIVAVEDAWGFDWMKPGVLARYMQHGQEVIVGEKMRMILRLPEAVEVQGR